MNAAPPGLLGSLRRAGFARLVLFLSVAIFCAAVPVPETDRFVGDLDGRIARSIYSLPSGFVEPGEARTLISAIAAARPARDILVLSDLERPADLPRSVTWSRPESPLSPWPRDPFLLGWRGTTPLLLERPNRQTGREGDREMAGAVMRGWAQSATGSMATVRAVATSAFHAGHLLIDGDDVWLSIHSVEPETLRRLGATSVPVASFERPRGVVDYSRAARGAAEALGSELGKRPRWVHPDAAQAGLSAAETVARMRLLGAGAGQDLDAYLTFLPGGSVLVGSAREGERVLAAATPEDLVELRTFYGLGPSSEALRSALLAGHRRFSGDFSAYLDAVAAHLGASGRTVERSPVVFVPTDSFADRRGVDYPWFLLTWNNLVLEPAPTGGGFLAEGFDLHFPSVDRQVEALLVRRQVGLSRLPALRRSIVLGGGYRCASNHLRERPAGNGVLR
jgi:hypothetical protein